MADDITTKEREEYTQANVLVGSVRGQFILGQALYLATEVLEKVEEQRREHSNISDMKLLLKHIFPFYALGRSVTDDDFVTQLEKMEQFLDEFPDFEPSREE